MTDYSVEEIICMIKLAAKKLKIEDDYLLENDLHEQTISHRLAMYLELMFFGYEYKVDCEYNKHKGCIKGQPGKFNEDKLREFETEFNEVIKEMYEEEKEFKENIENALRDGAKKSDENDNMKKVRPDIVVHERGSDSNNLAVIEVKKDISNSSNKEIAKDIKKLALFQLSKDDIQGLEKREFITEAKVYGYEYGILFEIDMNGYDYKVKPVNIEDLFKDK